MGQDYVSYKWCYCCVVLLLLVSFVRGQTTIRAISFDTETLSTRDEMYAMNLCKGLKEQSLRANGKWDGDFFLPPPGKDIEESKKTYCLERTLERSGKNSWSPVAKVLVTCPSRMPVMSIEHRCVSQYCTDPETGKENLNLITQQLTMNETVCVKSRMGGAIPRVEKRSVGCTCLFPVIN